MNWIHLCNLIEAHILAAEALTASKGYIAVSECNTKCDGEQLWQNYTYVHFNVMCFRVEKPILSMTGSMSAFTTGSFIQW